MIDVAEFHRRDSSQRQIANLLSGGREPEGTSQFIPLRQALEDLGKAYFPDTWSGTEQSASPAPDLPDPMNRTASLLALEPDPNEQVRWWQQPSDAALSYAGRLLDELAPDLAASRRSIASRCEYGWPPARPIFTRAQWAAAQNLARKRAAIIREEWRRLHHVRSQFKELPDYPSVSAARRYFSDRTAAIDA